MPARILVDFIDGPVDRELSQNATQQQVPSTCGAECIFLGRTRAETHDIHGQLRKLSYEAFRPLADQILLHLADQATKLFKCEAITILHSVGSVPIGCASVYIQTITGHRAESFAACRFLIDELKKQAPIWKREVWADGTTWSEGTPIDPPDH